MRALPVLVVLVLAGCFGPAPPAAPPPVTHVTDCRVATDTEVCRASTPDSPLKVSTFVSGNRSRVGFLLANNGSVSLVFDADPPPFNVYVREDRWIRIATGKGGDAPGVTVAPGANTSVVLSYGRFAGDRARDVRVAEPEEPHDWPSGTYRACFSAHPGDDAAWVRGCKDFRIR